MSDILDRLNRHAKDFDLTESEADEPGNIVHDLCEAQFVIKRLREAITEARICLVNYSDRKYAVRVFQALEKIEQAYPAALALTGGEAGTAA